MGKSDIEKEYKDLLVKIRRNGVIIDKKKLDSAWEFAKLAHTGQTRISGKSFVLHPLETAKILSEWRMDGASIIAAILHDAVEWGGAITEDLEKEFGKEVASLVNGVTQVAFVKLKSSRKEWFVENLRKMFLAMAKDLRVVVIKLAERLHNMETLDVLPPNKQKRIALETLDVFAPLAERLGMGEVKTDLEDVAFKYAYPEAYVEIRSKSKRQYQKAKKQIKAMKHAVLKRLAKEGIKAEVSIRQKHLYSLWKKMERREIDWDFEKIYDIVAMRIIVKNISECYMTLGVVHDIYKPIPNDRISDFIAQPKPNGYRSIHTRVFGPGKQPVEIQIRTFKMHKQAEHGVAAHWAYAQAKARGVKDELLEEGRVRVENKLGWVKQLAKWQEEIRESDEFLKAVKFDVLAHRNFVFSPKGDVYDLPVGATPVDYAYSVHTGLGNYIKSAKVNDKIVPLSYKLKSGDVVEILKTKNPKLPNKNWLRFVKTTHTMSAIRKNLRNNLLKE